MQARYYDPVIVYQQQPRGICYISKAPLSYIQTVTTVQAIDRIRQGTDIAITLNQLSFGAVF